MGFRQILLRAKAMDNDAMTAIAKMYAPLLTKEAIVKGVFDEDLFQELQATLLTCIKKIRDF